MSEVRRQRSDDKWKKVEREIFFLSSVFCPLLSGTYRVVYVKINITDAKKNSNLPEHQYAI
jgi:hypothetical protein